MRKKSIHALVSDRHHDIWHQFADRCGVSVSAMIAGLAEEIDDESQSDTLPFVEFGKVIAYARQYDASRRRRAPRNEVA